MNTCAYQQQQQQKRLLVGRGGEMIWGDSLISLSQNGIACPKPRRLGVPNPSLRDQRPLKFCQVEVSDSGAGTELLDILLKKGNEKSTSAFVDSSSPPFFCGSPPSRASNPLIQDSNFGSNNGSPAPAFHEPLPSNSAIKNGGYVRAQFGFKPAAVRIEGFNCRGISAVA